MAYAMEFLMKHWDGYAGDTNNTYIYNDVKALEAPGLGDVKFKLITSGIDQTFQPQQPFKMGSRGLVAKLVRGDPGRFSQLVDQIRTYRDTVFSRDIQQTALKPMLDKMEALLVGFGVPDVVPKIAVVRQQLRLAESVGYLCAGLPGNTTSVYVLNGDTSEPLHASNTEGVPAGVPNPANFEVYHPPFADDNNPSDLWSLNDLGGGSRSQMLPMAAFCTPATPW